MDKKISVWQGLLIGSIITPICIHLKYPLNLGVMILVIFGLLVYVIKDRKKYNKFNFAGMVSAIIGSIIIVFSIIGKVMEGFSFGTQILTSLGMFFLGIVLIGIGNHINNPERVPMKTLIIGASFSSVLLLYFWLLLKWSGG